MKKLFAMILVLALLVGAACAEISAGTRVRALERDGEVYELAETLYDAEGYSIWYQAELLEAGMYYDHVMFKPVGAAEEDESIYYLIVPIELTGDEECAAMIAESVGGYEPEWTISEVRELTAEAGSRILSVDANNGTELHRYYLVQGEAFSLCITAVYPAAEAMDYSPCFDDMTMTAELKAAIAEF